MQQSGSLRWLRILSALTAGACVFSAPVKTPAQVVLAPVNPPLGSSNTVTADPPVHRPSTRSCTVTLLENQAFADFNNKSFSYAPPAACPGPWSKVVLTADFTVTAGRQFDRTAQFSIGNANIFYGTTAEPRANLSPSWHVERDVTDLSALFRAPQAGQAILGNIVNGTYTSIIYANAHLEFYPASYRNPAPYVADLVVPLPNAAGGATTLNTTSSQLAQPVTLPQNTEAVYLDVFAQSQSNDEFWYTCVPNDVMAELQSCGNTAFRETEITVDGQPAGVAPVFPWIFTGGIDPYLWEPIPGVQTLNFKPYRVDLTPFAGLLADGQPHTVGISVFNANSYFLATANLLVFTDHDSAQVSGKVTSNTLSAAPTPSVVESLQADTSGNVTGSVKTDSIRNFAITGYVNTSRGRVRTTVEQTVRFDNTQNFTINKTKYVQDIAQATVVSSKTTKRDSSFTTSEEREFRYPLTFNIDDTTNPDGSIVQTSVADQKYIKKQTQNFEEFPFYASAVRNHVATQDTYTLTPQPGGGYAITSHTGQKSSQRYKSFDTQGHCYSRQLTAENNVLTGVKDNAGCEDR